MFLYFYIPSLLFKQNRQNMHVNSELVVWSLLEP